MDRNEPAAPIVPSIISRDSPSTATGERVRAEPAMEPKRLRSDYRRPC
jgi:antitoxin (DNA-binding transcriptional repressor) of toxin-antitoxin stability system